MQWIPLSDSVAAAAKARERASTASEREHTTVVLEAPRCRWRTADSRLRTRTTDAGSIQARRSDNEQANAAVTVVFLFWVVVVVGESNRSRPEVPSELGMSYRNKKIKETPGWEKWMVLLLQSPRKKAKKKKVG